MTSAVVLGGGFAGVLAARVLARHVDRVTLVEAGRYPAHPGARPGLPQGHHNHVLVTGGARALETLLPGTPEALIAAGARRRGLTGDALILSAGGWVRRQETGAYVISATRWLTDHVVRRRALAGPDPGGREVLLRQRTRVLGLAGDAARITGVVVAGPASDETIPADLVVDATGRRSRAPQWLRALGGPPVEEETVESGLAYVTRIYRAPAALGADIPAIMLHPRSQAGRDGHGATLFPIEGDRWIVTLTGTRGNEPPVAERDFTACAYGLGSPIVAELLAAAEPLGAARPYRVTANRRRYFERRARTDGLVVLGDALSATNPVYSHGMSVAALSVLRLHRELDRLGTSAGQKLPATACQELQAAVATEVDVPWRMAVDADRPGRGPVLPAQMRSRLDRSMLGSPELLGDLFRAQTLIGPAAAVDGTLRRALAVAPPPPLSTDDAVAQFPALSGWWRSAPTRRTA